VNLRPPAKPSLTAFDRSRSGWGKGNRTTHTLAAYADRMPSHDWVPLVPPDCSCTEHVDNLLNLVIPNRDWDGDPTVEELVATGSLGAGPMPARDRFMKYWDEDGSESLEGPYHWMVGAADEITGCYHDDAELPLDKSIAAQPGVDRVCWYDREEFYVGAPGLCEKGMLAAVIRALADPRVRVPRA
jgi:hypothetical protein